MPAYQYLAYITISPTIPLTAMSPSTHPSARPATSSAQASVLPAPTTARPYPAAAPASYAAPARPAAAEREEEDSARRDFYAWCAGCEGYGSIF